MEQSTFRQMMREIYMLPAIGQYIGKDSPQVCPVCNGCDEAGCTPWGSEREDDCYKCLGIGVVPSTAEYVEGRRIVHPVTLKYEEMEDPAN